MAKAKDNKGLFLEMLVMELKPPAWKRVIRLNAPEWYFVVGGCVSALFTGALQPCFAIIFSEIMGVSIHGYLNVILKSEPTGNSSLRIFIGE